jgi:hypothetical protein
MDEWAVPVSASYFCPHHAWNLCDTHFGHGKKKLRQKFRTSTITKPKDIVEVFQQFDNVTVTILGTIRNRNMSLTGIDRDLVG